MCQHISHYAILERRVWMIAEKNVLPCHQMHLDILFFLGRRLYDDDVQFGAGSIFFSLYFSLIHLDFCSSHEKKPQQPLNFFSFQIQSLFYLKKSLQIEKFFSILSSLSFSSLEFSLHFFEFFRWLIDFLCFLQFHPHSSFFFLALLSKKFIIYNFILQIKFMILFNITNIYFSLVPFFLNFFLFFFALLSRFL